MNQFNKSVITKEMIFLEEDLKEQAEVLDFIVENAKKNNYIVDDVSFLESVLKREEEVSTAIGYSIAIPHGKNETVLHPFITFIRIANEIRWSKENEEMVQLVFLIGVPKESEGNIHLKFISQLSKKLLDEEFRKKLLTEKNKDKIFEQLSLIDI